MNAVRFLARNAADAVGQIRSRLGPDAVVLTVTQVRAGGIGRILGQHRLEVLAYKPEFNVVDAPDGTWRPEGQASAGWNARRNPYNSARTATGSIALAAPQDDDVVAAVGGAEEAADSGPSGLGGDWRSGAVLHQMGLLPLYVEKVLERVRSTHGDEPPASCAREIALVRSVLASFWRGAPRDSGNPASIHVFVGPPGSGKTTALCKWLAKSVLAEGRKARAWRLDARSANFAGMLDLYGEILGVPIERKWNGTPTPAGFDIGFIDLPGIDPTDARSVKQLRDTLDGMPGVRVHLVLNAAYDAAVSLAQARAFAALPVNDLIFTHLDEEKRRGKLWNFVLGTNYTIRFLSGGQNIPGDFTAATAGLLLPEQMRGELQNAAAICGQRRVGRHFAKNELQASAG